MNKQLLKIVKFLIENKDITDKGTTQYCDEHVTVQVQNKNEAEVFVRITIKQKYTSKMTPAIKTTYITMPRHSRKELE